jgi:hypothetical protein
MNATRRGTVSAVGLMLAAATLLAGCNSIGGFTGAAAGVATGTVTANPGVGIGVGVAVKAVTDDTIKRTLRRMHRSEQDEIARVAGALAVDEQKPWAIRHTIPYGNEHGEVRVTRAFTTPLATCKDFAFSVIDGEAARASATWYLATACQQGAKWKWAVAEPAVERWDALQ